MEPTDLKAEEARICRRIEECRRSAGLTQAELAQGAGMSLDGVSRILLGRRTPQLRSLISLGNALGVDYRDFLAGPREEVLPRSRALQRLGSEDEVVLEALLACLSSVRGLVKEERSRLLRKRAG